MLEIKYKTSHRCPVAVKVVKGFKIEMIANDPRVRLDHETGKIHVPNAEIGKTWIAAGADEAQIVLKK